MKRFFLIVLSLAAAMDLAALDLKPVIDLGEVATFSLGAGFGLCARCGGEGDTPEHGSLWEIAAGYGFDWMKWYGFGRDYYRDSKNSSVSNSLFYNVFYLRTRFNQVLLGDGVKDPFYMDFSLSHVKGILPAGAEYKRPLSGR